MEEVLKNCGNKMFNATERALSKDTTTKYYEIYERNGEISEKDLLEAQGKGTSGDENKFVNAKIIVAGLKKGDKGEKYVLFAEEIKRKPYTEAHRGRYEGR